MSFVSNGFIFSIFFLIYLSPFYINCYFVLPFETVFIKDKTVNDTDYFTNLTQSELHVNFNIGSKKSDINLVLKMDKYGFLIYENAYDYNNSETYETFEPDFEDKMTTNWVPSKHQIPSKDILYLPTLDSKGNNYNIKKTNQTIFLRVKEEVNKSNYFNEMFYEYGIIGLKFNDNLAFNAPELIKSLKASRDIDSYTFYLTFDKTYKNGFATNNNKGKFYIGKELTEPKEKANYINCIDFGGELSWSLDFDNIYLENKGNKLIEFESRKKANIIANFPYIKSNSEYYEYINKNFFDELKEKNICHKIEFTRNEIYVDQHFYSYACDSQSKYFMDYLEKNFPDLIFEHKGLNEKFILTKKDLFAYNTNNDSDKNLYFLIISGLDYYDWFLGIPFLKNYVFSYDYDNKNIGYYKYFGKEEEGGDNPSFFEGITFKIVIVILLIIIIFCLGMFFQKYYRKSRKKKANELDDDFEYESHKDKVDNNVKNKNENESLGINE